MAKNAQPVVAGNRKSLWKQVYQQKGLYLLLLPGLIYLIVFKYIPMLGVVIAFQNFSPFLGFTGSPWVGFDQFKLFFTGNDFWMLMRNTLGISLLNLIFYFPAPIILALFLNEIRCSWYKRLAQTLVYIPHFISFVIVASLSYTLFNVNDGIIHEILLAITGKNIDILSKPQYFWGLIVGQSIWKESGYGTIVFLAALSGVDVQLYEAAKVDGAGRWRLMWHVTLPAIKSTIVIMLIMRVGSLLNTGYEQIFLMRNSLNVSKAEVIDTYVYTRGISGGQYSYSTAVGLFKSIVGMVMVLSADRLAKKMGESGLY
ncbi:MAG: sugar ABC transporter permease [Lachnospiraceae bacterium]|nr:sugar ABC transporter permease [Lachnospiraceae bacterium]